MEQPKIPLLRRPKRENNKIFITDKTNFAQDHPSSTRPNFVFVSRRSKDRQDEKILTNQHCVQEQQKKIVNESSTPISELWSNLEKEMIKARKCFVAADAEEALAIQRFNDFLCKYGEEAKKVIPDKWFDRVKRREEARARYTLFNTSGVENIDQ